MKILIALSRFPYPLEKGDKLRAYHQIRCLSQKHDIYLVAVHEQSVSLNDLEQLKPFCKEIFLLKQGPVDKCVNIAKAFFSGLPLQCGYFYSRRNQKRFDEIVAQVRPDHIYCQLIRMAEYVKNYPVVKTLDYQDVFSKGALRRAEKAVWFMKPFFMMEYRRVARYENVVFNRFNHKTIITAVDRDLIPNEHRDEIVVVANGVDFEHFSYHQEEKVYDLIFSGNMNYAPNVDAAEFLAKEIFPALKREMPGLKLVLCGATPAPRVKALQSEDVIVTGWVDNMAEWYAESRIFVAPMRMGTGLQNKLLEAMAMQLPCVTSPLAAKPLEHADAKQAVMPCSTTSGYVEAIRSLLQDPELYQRLSNNGYQYVHEQYDWQNAVEKLQQLMSQ